MRWSLIMVAAGLGALVLASVALLLFLELTDGPTRAGDTKEESLPVSPKDKLPKLSERKFTEIDRDNFDDILKGCKPRLAFRVDNKLQDDGSELSVELNFEKLADFSPEAVAKQIGPLNDLLEVRNQLKRLDELSRDLLDYAKPISVEPIEITFDF